MTLKIRRRHYVQGSCGAHDTRGLPPALRPPRALQLPTPPVQRQTIIPRLNSVSLDRFTRRALGCDPRPRVRCQSRPFPGVESSDRWRQRRPRYAYFHGDVGRPSELTMLGQPGPSTMQFVAWHNVWTPPGVDITWFNGAGGVAPEPANWMTNASPNGTSGMPIQVLPSPAWETLSARLLPESVAKNTAKPAHGRASP